MLVIFILGKVSSLYFLLKTFSEETEILLAASSLRHNLVTSLANIILASLISAPFSFPNLLSFTNNFLLLNNTIVL